MRQVLNHTAAPDLDACHACGHVRYLHDDGKAACVACVVNGKCITVGCPDGCESACQAFREAVDGGVKDAAINTQEPHVPLSGDAWGKV